MKKIGLVSVAALLLMSTAALAAEKSANNQTKSRGDAAQARGQMRDRMDPAAQQKMLNDRIAALKKEHQAALGELQAIKQLAVKEKATETAAALDKLMAKREQEFQKRIEPELMRLKKLEALQKGDGKARDKSADKAARGRERPRQKGDGAKTKTNK
ncbi:MAG: hypothetical protein MUC88_23035 [Planctomycetes bacterium]|jgi:hypothetical protein|nr:hypothetical protein [Planctomycetota bacterium]